MRRFRKEMRTPVSKFPNVSALSREKSLTEMQNNNASLNISEALSSS